MRTSRLMREDIFNFETLFVDRCQLRRSLNRTGDRTRLNYTSRSCRVACPCVDTSSYDEKDEQYVLLSCLHGRCHSRSVTFASTCTSDYIP